MKKYVKQMPVVEPVEFTIDVIYFPTGVDTVEFPVVASKYEGYSIPDGSLMPGNKDAEISEQEKADYNAFIETVEDLLTDHCDLEIVYQDQPTEYSHYYSFFAKDGDKVLFKFRVRLRLSNQGPHRTNAQQANKAKEKKQVQQWLDGRPDYDGKVSPTPLTYVIIINDQNTKFHDYTEAFMYIYNEVERWIKIMRGI